MLNFTPSRRVRQRLAWCRLGDVHQLLRRTPTSSRRCGETGGVRIRPRPRNDEGARRASSTSFAAACSGRVPEPATLLWPRRSSSISRLQ